MPASSPGRRSSPPATDGFGQRRPWRRAQRAQSRRPALASADPRNVCNGADDCRRAVREQISAGADVIKISRDRRRASATSPGGLNQQMMDDEMRAIVETAKMFGRKVAAHAHGVDGINAAFAPGSIRSSTAPSPTTRPSRSTSRRGAYYVPTLLAPAAALADGQRGALTPAQYEKAQQAAGNAEKSFAGRSARASRLPSAPTPASAQHGDNAEEFALMVEERHGARRRRSARPRSTPPTCSAKSDQRSARSSPARTPTSSPCDGDPIANVRLLEQVDFVMKHGRVHKLGGKRAADDVD